MRFLFPVLVFLVLFRCAKSLLTFRKQPEIWAWLNIGDEASLPVTHWENTIGRGKGCDIVVDLPTISRSHAVLTRYDDGSWSISDIGSRGGVQVNGETVSIRAINFEEPFSLGGVDFRLEKVTKEEQKEQESYRIKPGSRIKPDTTLFFLTVFQILSMLQMILYVGAADVSDVMFGYIALMILEWVIFLVFRAMRRTGYEVETIAFFLCTLGISVLSTADPGGMKKEIVAILVGIFLFFVVGWSLRRLERAKKVRYLAAAVGVALLLFNVVFGKEVYGARNWIFIGPLSFQPSEIVKVCFVFVGASTMDRIVSKRNLTLFILYSGFICGCLVLISDFGAALIFFAAFLGSLHSFDLVTLPAGAYLCRCGFRGGHRCPVPSLYSAAVCRLGTCMGIRDRVWRLSADPINDVYCFWWPLWIGRADVVGWKYVASIGYGPCFCPGF